MYPSNCVLYRTALSVFITYSSWTSPSPQSIKRQFSRCLLPCVENRYSTFSRQIQWLSTACGKIFLRGVSSHVQFLLLSRSQVDGISLAAVWTIWPKNLTWWSITMLGRGRRLDAAWDMAWIKTVNTVCFVICQLQNVAVFGVITDSLLCFRSLTKAQEMCGILKW